jgi:L-rhamnose mutarotase
MQRVAFKMFLDPGREADYRARHDAIWPELAALLKAAGISNYSIHLDPSTHDLFAYLEWSGERSLEALAGEPVMRRWWDHMKDVMRANPDGSPVTAPLTEMFHLP